MPPYRRGTKRKASTTKKVSRKRRTVRPKARPKTYVKAVKKRGGGSMLRLRTLQPKQLVLTIPYRQTIFFTDMGAYPIAGTAPQPNKLCSNSIVIDMTSPLTNCVQFATPTGAGGSPQFNKTNPVPNLMSELQPYFDGHEKMQVIASSCIINATQLPNQYKLSQFNSLRPDLGYVQPTATSGGVNNMKWDSNHPAANGATIPTLDGNVYAAMVKHRDVHSLPDITLPISADNATLHKLKTEVPGIVMRNMQCTPHTQKQVRMTSTFTPRSYFGVKDARDNQDMLHFDMTNPPNKTCHTTFGLFNAFPPAQTGTAGRQQTPLFKVEVLVNYKLLMQRRRNVFNNNQPRDEVDMGAGGDEL